MIMNMLPIPVGLIITGIKPFLGATARWTVTTPMLWGKEHVSVYFDATSALGSCDFPYYEALMGEAKRYDVGEEAKMMGEIESYLRERETNFAEEIALCESALKDEKPVDNS